MTRLVLFALLAIVAAAAAVLSFAALRDLGLACGFDPRLAWLLPVVVDAGAAAGSVTWLTHPPGVARVFGRRLAIVLLVSSVVGNGIAHLLEAYRLEAAWWLVVAVSGLAPAVLASVVHLTVVSVQGRTERPESTVGTSPEGAALVPTPGGSIFGDSRSSQVGEVAGRDDLNQPEPAAGPDDRVAELIADGGIGRRRLARALGVTEYEARALLAERRNGNGAAQ